MSQIMIDAIRLAGTAVSIIIYTNKQEDIYVK